MIKDKNDLSSQQKIEIIDSVMSSSSSGHHKRWLEKAVQDIQKKFDTLKLSDQLKVMKFVQQYHLIVSSHPIYIAENIKNMTPKQIQIAMTALKKVNLLTEAVEDNKSAFI